MEISARIDIHFDKIMTYLNQPASIPILDQTQEFYQCCQVNQLDMPQESTPYVDTIFKFVPSLFHLNKIKEFE